jgi:hypothetical protein
METRFGKLVFAIPVTYYAQFLPLLPLIIVGVLFILADMWTAWDLSRRLKKQKKSTGKLKSKHAQRVIDTMIKMMTAIILAWALEKYVLVMLDSLYLANWVTAIFCAVQGISILENISSESDATWAKVLQKILINKANRHYDLELGEVKTEQNERTTNGQEGSNS